ncbi:MAG: hypothetical protein HRT38_02610 [Alteromonadaceae bacterium]|nr:hypothetical protein [Alteromonadaceae bacterium]
MFENSVKNTFEDSIEASLSFTIKGKNYPVAGANIKECELNLLSTGFTGKLEFWLSNEGAGDKLTEAFVSDEIIYLTLSVKNQSFSKKEKGEAIKLKAIAGQRSVYEQQFMQLKDGDILFRKYQCEFTDVAQFLWQLHFPCELYVDKTLKHMISEQVVDPIVIKYNWEKLTEKQQMICLGLGATLGTNYDVNSGAVSGKVSGDFFGKKCLSFYDFLVNYLAQNCVLFIYDYDNNSYQITDKKEPPKSALEFLPHQITDLQFHCAKADVQSINLLNAHAEQTKTISVKKSKLNPTIKKDKLIVTPFAKTLEAQKKLETQHEALKTPTLDFNFNSYPLKAVHPGSGICFNHKLWNKALLYYKKKFRISSCYIRLTALNLEADSDLNMSFTKYSCEYQCRGEDYAAKDFLRTPELIQPFSVEGIVLCDLGEKTDKTYQYYKNETTKQLEYRISIPLWKQEIKVQFKPDFMPPHFYFPLYKGVRLELNMSLFDAQITRVLDWGKGVFLEQESQGNHLLFGKNNKDETSLRHGYEDKKPVFSIKRTKDKDTELLQLEEGKIIFQTKEDD